jgi:hypothetical protein
MIAVALFGCKQVDTKIECPSNWECETPTADDAELNIECIDNNSILICYDDRPGTSVRGSFFRGYRLGDECFECERPLLPFGCVSAENQVLDVCGYTETPTTTTTTVGSTTSVPITTTIVITTTSIISSTTTTSGGGSTTTTTPGGVTTTTSVSSGSTTTTSSGGWSTTTTQPTTSQPSTYQWEIKNTYSAESLVTTWTVYDDKIELQAQAKNGDFFLCNMDLKIAQNNGTMQISTYSSDENTAVVTYKPGFDGCEDIRDGVTVVGRIDKFPSWFDCKKSFKIYYEGDIYSGQDQRIEIPEETRLPGVLVAVAAIPKDTVNLSGCQSILGNKVGCMDMEWWIGEYNNMPSLLFNGSVKEGEFNFCYDEISIEQNDSIISEISNWGASNNAASVECPNCCPGAFVFSKLGTQLYGAIYNFPTWFDITKPFTLSYSSLDIDFNRTSRCAASKVLGNDTKALNELRKFRDNTLAKSAIGRKAIQIYYTNADSINAAFERSPALRAVTRRVLEVIAPMVGREEE